MAGAPQMPEYGDRHGVWAGHDAIWGQTRSSTSTHARIWGQTRSLGWSRRDMGTDTKFNLISPGWRRGRPRRRGAAERAERQACNQRLCPAAVGRLRLCRAAHLADRSVRFPGRPRGQSRSTVRVVGLRSQCPLSGCKSHLTVLGWHCVDSKWAKIRTMGGGMTAGTPR